MNKNFNDDIKTYHKNSNIIAKMQNNKATTIIYNNNGLDNNDKGDCTNIDNNNGICIFLNI